MHSVRPLSNAWLPRARVARLTVAREPSLGYLGFEGTITDRLACGVHRYRDGRPIPPLGPDRERAIPIAKHSQWGGGRARANTAISFRFDATCGRIRLIPYLSTRGATPCAKVVVTSGDLLSTTPHLEDNRRGLWSLVILVFPQPGASIVLLFSCHAGSYVAEGVPLEPELSYSADSRTCFKWHNIFSELRSSH